MNIKRRVGRELARMVSGARDSIYIETPYLVLSNPAIDLFKELLKEQPDIDIRIATNSLASTDSWHCYALSFQQKQVMLRDLIFKIFEFKPMPGEMLAYMPGFDKLKGRALTPTEKESLDPAMKNFMNIMNMSAISPVFL